MSNKCERCGRESSTLTGSWFNEQMICPQCDYLEHEHPLIEEAKRVERQQCLNGNYNFQGIGLPEDLKEVSRIAGTIAHTEKKKFEKPLSKNETRKQAHWIFESYK